MCERIERTRGKGLEGKGDDVVDETGYMYVRKEFVYAHECIRVLTGETVFFSSLVALSRAMCVCAYPLVYGGGGTESRPSRGVVARGCAHWCSFSLQDWH